MTLFEVVNTLKEIAKNEPNINYVGDGDILTLNSLPNIDYNVFFVTQNQHKQDENTITYTLYLYYIDRLTIDESNTLEIHSRGILSLGNIINKFNEIVDDAEIIYSINYNTFTHRFADACAGVYATVQVEINNNIGVCSY